MASDDNESDKDLQPSSESARQSPLPPEVERALAKARAVVDNARPAGTPAKSKDARWLALIPLTAFVLAMLLMMPRTVAPEDVPLPQVDGKALEAIRRDDDKRAASARETRLPGGALAVGTRLRALNKLQATNASAEDIGVARTSLEVAFRTFLSDEQGPDALRTLRAVQLETFLAEVERFEATGQATPELQEIAGGFVDRMSAAGWIKGRTVVLDDAQRRAAYKLVWTATLGADSIPGLTLALDEQRVLYTLYIAHPHAGEAKRPWHESKRRAATTDDDCTRAMAEEKLSMEEWRTEKIKRLGQLDPTYPTAFALGVALYRARRYDQSAQAFQNWVVAHPDGPLSLRARNHLKAALAMSGSS